MTQSILKAANIGSTKTAESNPSIPGDIAQAAAGLGGPITAGGFGALRAQPGEGGDAALNSAAGTAVGGAGGTALGALLGAGAGAASGYYGAEQQEKPSMMESVAPLAGIGGLSGAGLGASIGRNPKSALAGAALGTLGLGGFGAALNPVERKRIEQSNQKQRRQKALEGVVGGGLSGALMGGPAGSALGSAAGFRRSNG